MEKLLMRLLICILLILPLYSINIENEINSSKNIINPSELLEIKEFQKDGAIFTAAFFIGLGISIFMSGGTAVANNVAVQRHQNTNNIIAKYQTQCENEIRNIAQTLTANFDKIEIEMKHASTQAKLALISDETYKSHYLSILLAHIIGSGEPEYVARIVKGSHISDNKKSTNVATDIGLSLIQSFGEALLQEAGLSFIPGVGTVWSVGKLSKAIYQINQSEERKSRMISSYKGLCKRTRERVKFQTCKNTHAIYEQIQNIHFSIKNLNEKHRTILGAKVYNKLLKYITKALKHSKDAYDSRICANFRKVPKAKCLNRASDNPRVCCPVTHIWYSRFPKKDKPTKNMDKGYFKVIKVSNDQYLFMLASDCTVKSRFQRPYYSGLATITSETYFRPSSLFFNDPFGYTPWEPVVRTAKNYNQFRKIKAEDLPKGLDKVRGAISWVEQRDIIQQVEHFGIKHYFGWTTEVITYLVATRFPGPPIIDIGNSNKYPEADTYFPGNIQEVPDLDGGDLIKLYFIVQDYLTPVPEAKENTMSDDEKKRLYTISTLIADEVRKTNNHSSSQHDRDNHNKDTQQSATSVVNKVLKKG